MKQPPLVRRARRFAANIIETVRAPLIVVDAGRRLSSCNAAFLEVFALREEEAEGLLLDDIHGCWRSPRALAALAEVLEEDRELEGFELEAELPGRGQRAFLVNARRLRGLEGEARYAVLSLEDITELRGQVLRLTRERDEELARHEITLEQLRHSNRLGIVGKLTAGLAHELGTPLNVILGRATLLSRRPDTATEARDDLDVIADQARAMAGLLRLFLDHARRDGEGPNRAELAPSLERAARVLAPLARKSGVELALEPGPGLGLSVALSPDRLQQVVTNLIVNAIDAQPEGGRVSLAVEDKGDERLIIVEDEGPGLAPAVLARIFEPFFTTKPPGRGTGLGLSVCKGLVEEAGGRITAGEAPGGGARFVLALPRGDEG